MTTHVPGTVYPLGGRPHPPTLCAFRRSRRAFRPVTVLCYEHGDYEIIGPNGSICLSTAEGPIPHSFCEKHVHTWFGRPANTTGLTILRVARKETDT